MMLAWDKRAARRSRSSACRATTLPLVLLTKHERIKSLADFTVRQDRHAGAGLAADVRLQMASEKLWGPGQQDRLKTNVVGLPHPGGAQRPARRAQRNIRLFLLCALHADRASQAGHPQAPDECRRLWRQVHVPRLRSAKKTLEEQPKLADIVIKAMTEAAELIRRTRSRRRRSTPKVEPSKTMTAADIEALLGELANDFRTRRPRRQERLDFMQRIGQLKNAPANWSDVFVPAMSKSSSD